MTRHFLSPEAQALYSAARLDAVRALAQVAHEEGCAFVVVCGDIFDSNHLDRSVVVRALEAMRDFTVPVYLLPANHDPLNAASIYRSPEFAANRPENVHFLGSSDPVMVAGSVAELVGAPWDSKQPAEDLVARACTSLEAREPGAPPRVLVAHGAIAEGGPDQHNPALIRLATAEAALASATVEYIALGDRHSTTAVGTTGRIWYAGTPLVTDYDELDPNNALVVEIANDRTVSVTSHRVGDWAFLKQRFDVNGADDVDHVGDWLDALPDKHTTVVKLSFEGTLNLTENARLEELLDHNAHLFAALETWERRTDLAVLPDDADFGDVVLVGAARKALDDLRTKAEAGGDSGQTAQDALALLFRLAR